jgi:hypothetical protein
LIGFSVSRLAGSWYIVSDQKAFTGGSWPGPNLTVYRLVAPSSGFRSESTK